MTMHPLSQCPCCGATNAISADSVMACCISCGRILRRTEAGWIANGSSKLLLISDGVDYATMRPGMALPLGWHDTGKRFDTVEAAQHEVNEMLHALSLLGD